MRFECQCHFLLTWIERDDYEIKTPAFEEGGGVGGGGGGGGRGGGGLQVETIMVYFRTSGLLCPCNDFSVSSELCCHQCWK